MNYTKSIIFYIFIFLALNLRANDTLSALPEHFKVSNSPFLDKITSLKDLECKFFLSNNNKIIPTEETIFKNNGQELIKTKESLYLFISQTGFIYRLEDKQDSAYTFHRIDATININYNIDCNNFVWNKHIYSYGGYGFWKLNGHLRSFNYLDKEWDIAPTNNEIISNGFNWFDKKAGKLYVPFQFIINGGIAKSDGERGSKNYDSYYLDIDSKKWVKLGSMNTNTKKLLFDANITNSFFAIDSGCILINQDEAYYFNFLTNKIYKSKNAELNQFFLRRANNKDIFLYKDSIISFSKETQTFSTKKLSYDFFVELNHPIWGLDNNYYYLVVLILLLSIIVFFSIWLYRKMVKKKIQESNLKILKTKTIGQAFVGTELSLIQLLLAAASKNTNVEINQINRVLGIKDKNIGLQKKVRSDVINAINEKYAIIVNADIPLISSSRKIDDKRFYEYFINEEEIKSIKKILDKK
jgi:hypothetical protein